MTDQKVDEAKGRVKEAAGSLNDDKELKNEGKADQAASSVKEKVEPGLPWERLRRRATPAEIEAASGTPVLLGDDPALVPLETLPGRNQCRFPPSERPPWQWRVPGIYPG